MRTSQNSCPPAETASTSLKTGARFLKPRAILVKVMPAPGKVSTFYSNCALTPQNWCPLPETAQKPHKENTTLKEMAVKLGYVTPEQIDEWVVPDKMVGNI